MFSPFDRTNLPSDIDDGIAALVFGKKLPQKGETTPKIPADDGSVKWFLLYDFLPKRSAEKLIHTPAIWESDDPAGCFQSDQIRICTYLSWSFDRGLYDLDTLLKGYDILIKINARDVFHPNGYGSQYKGENLLKAFMQARPLHDKRSGYCREPFEMKSLMESWRIFTAYYMDNYEDEYEHLSKKLPVTKLPVNADDIAADSRRKIKKDDIIFAELAKSDETSGSSDYLVFTETALYQFVNHKIQDIIRYAEIEDADFTDDSVSVTTQDKNCVNIDVGPYSDIKEKSPRILFNLLMDIKERVEK